MSSDFNINLPQLLEKGLIVATEDFKSMAYFTDEEGNVQTYKDEGTRIQFSLYEYWRDCDIEGNELHISCSGSFRRWLTQHLIDNQIEYVEN